MSTPKVFQKTRIDKLVRIDHKERSEKQDTKEHWPPAVDELSEKKLPV